MLGDMLRLNGTEGSVEKLC